MPAKYKKMRVNGKQVSVHRYVMEQHIGRPLLITEYVHHKNHDRFDNRIENLEIMSPKEHAQHHNIGRKHSDETRARVSQSLKGNQRRAGIPHSDAIRRQISESVTKARKNQFWSTKKL